MKKRVAFLFLLFVVLLSMSGCGAAPAPYSNAAAAKDEPTVVPEPTQLPPPTGKPTAVPEPTQELAKEAAEAPAGPPPPPQELLSAASGYVDAANAGDYETAVALFADDAVVSTPIGMFVGKEAVSNWLAENVKDHHAESEEWHMEGPFLVNTGLVTLERFEQAGAGPVKYRSEYRINPDGKILWFAPRVMLSPEQQDIVRAAADSPPPSLEEDIAIAKSYVETVNTGDFDSALAFFADDAVVSNPLGLFVGKEAVAQWLAEDVKTTRAEHSEWIAYPPFVAGIGEVLLDRFEKMGIGKVNSIAEFQIEDGKIVLFHPRVMLTPEQARIVQEAQASSKLTAIHTNIFVRQH
jgi:ketosteroid isomerase-like protein